MKITRSDLLALATAFNSLGGRDIEASDGDKKKVINKPYDIEGQARYAIAKMKRAAREHLEAIETERAALVDKHGPTAAEVDADPAKLAAFRADMAAFMKEEVDFVEHRIPVGHLKIGTNQLDLGLVEALLPVLDGEV